MRTRGIRTEISGFVGVGRRFERAEEGRGRRRRERGVRRWKRRWRRE